MVNKPTHKNGTIIEHVDVLQRVNTMQTDVTDCYYSGIYMIHMYCASKLLSKMQQYSNFVHKCQFGTMSHPEGGVHQTKMSLLPL